MIVNHFKDPQFDIQQATDTHLIAFLSLRPQFILQNKCVQMEPRVHVVVYTLRPIRVNLVPNYHLAGSPSRTAGGPWTPLWDPLLYTNRVGLNQKATEKLHQYQTIQCMSVNVPLYIQ